MNHNLSVNAYFRSFAAKHKPQFRFDGNSENDWREWHRQLLPAVKKTLGLMPEKVQLQPQLLAEWQDDGLIKQKIVFRVEDNLSATAYVFRLAKAKGRLPGILACHGHGPFGKELIMGNRSTLERVIRIKHGYQFNF